MSCNISIEQYKADQAKCDYHISLFMLTCKSKLSKNSIDGIKFEHVVEDLFKYDLHNDDFRLFMLAEEQKEKENSFGIEIKYDYRMEYKNPNMFIRTHSYNTETNTIYEAGLLHKSKDTKWFHGCKHIGYLMLKSELLEIYYDALHDKENHYKLGICKKFGISFHTTKDEGQGFTIPVEKARQFNLIKKTFLISHTYFEKYKLE